MRLILVQIFLVLSLIQCTHKILDSKSTYRKTLKFEVDGESSYGTYSAKKKQSYNLEIYVPQKPNFVKLTSCHQERIFIKPGKEIEFEYRPDPDIESGDLPCPLEISVIEVSGKNQWGLIDFKLKSESLPAHIQCNGSSIDAKGSYICQSRFGLIQSIEFQEELISYSPENCNTIEPRQGKKFYFSINEGNCFYIFSNKNGMFRLVTFGYNEALLDD